MDVSRHRGLEVRAVTKSYRGIQALAPVSFHALPGQAVGVVGGNGSGKSTLLDVISGWVRPDAGSVRYAGVDLVGLRPHTVARLGVRRSFQEVRIFPQLSTRDNVAVGLTPPRGERLLDPLLHPRAVRNAEAKAQARVAAWLQSVGIEDVGARSAEALSFGQQKLVELGRVMISLPAVILLDEPAAGLHSNTRKLLERALRTYMDGGGTVVMVEHDAEFVKRICDLVVRLDDALLTAPVVGGEQ